MVEIYIIWICGSSSIQIYVCFLVSMKFEFFDFGDSFSIPDKQKKIFENFFFWFIEFQIYFFSIFTYKNGTYYTYSESAFQAL